MLRSERVSRVTACTTLQLLPPVYVLYRRDITSVDECVQLLESIFTDIKVTARNSVEKVRAKQFCVVQKCLTELESPRTGYSRRIIHRTVSSSRKIRINLASYFLTMTLNNVTTYAFRDFIKRVKGGSKSNAPPNHQKSYLIVLTPAVRLDFFVKLQSQVSAILNDKFVLYRVAQKRQPLLTMFIKSY